MASLAFMNPAKRRSKRKVARRAPTTVAKRRSIRRKSSYRRNPLPKMGGIVAQLTQGAIGGAGAAGVGFIMGKIPLPEAVATGQGRNAAEALIGIGLGFALDKFLPKMKLGKAVAGGAVSVATYKALAEMGVPGADTGAVAGYGDGLLGQADEQLLGYYNQSQVYPTPQAMNGYYEMPHV